jgi:hypothetical protein
VTGGRGDGQERLEKPEAAGGLDGQEGRDGQEGLDGQEGRDGRDGQEERTSGAHQRQLPIRIPHSKVKPEITAGSSLVERTKPESGAPTLFKSVSSSACTSSEM